MRDTGDRCRWCLRADCPSMLIARRQVRTLYSEWSAAADDCVAHRDPKAGHDPGDEDRR